MPLILAAFAVLLFARGFRREGLALLAIGAAYAVRVVLVVMPWIRGGSGDLDERYGYLVADSTWWSLAPHVICALAPAALGRAARRPLVRSAHFHRASSAPEPARAACRRFRVSARGAV